MAICGNCKMDGVNVQHVRECFGVADKRPAKVVGDPTWHSDEDFPPPPEDFFEGCDPENDPVLEDEEDQFPGEVAVATKKAVRFDANVPFEEKDKAKELGARWDREKRLWYFPNGLPEEAPAHWSDPPSEEKPKPVIDDGFYYIVRGSHFDVYKVVESRTGNKYAKVLDKKEGTWDYRPGAIPDILQHGGPLDLETAKQFGRLYGICVRCGATLTDENSIEAGIGPICASKF